MLLATDEAPSETHTLLILSPSLNLQAALLSVVG